MSRIRVVGGSITKTSKGATTIEVLDGNFVSIAAKQNMWNGGENGVTHHEYVASEKKEENDATANEELVLFFRSETQAEGFPKRDKKEKVSIGGVEQLKPLPDLKYNQSFGFDFYRPDLYGTNTVIYEKEIASSETLEKSFEIDDQLSLEVKNKKGRSKFIDKEFGLVNSKPFGSQSYYIPNLLVAKGKTITFYAKYFCQENSIVNAKITLSDATGIDDFTQTLSFSKSEEIKSITITTSSTVNISTKTTLLISTEKDGISKVIGKCNIVPNKDYRPNFIFIDVFYNSIGTSTANYTNFVKELNEKAFNQAGISIVKSNNQYSLNLSSKDCLRLTKSGGLENPNTLDKSIDSKNRITDFNSVLEIASYKFYEKIALEMLDEIETELKKIKVKDKTKKDYPLIKSTENLADLVKADETDEEDKQKAYNKLINNIISFIKQSKGNYFIALMCNNLESADDTLAVGILNDRGLIISKSGTVDFMTCAHEIGHNFGLGHTFKKTGQGYDLQVPMTNTFENIMDYLVSTIAPCKSFISFQWSKMQKSLDRYATKVDDLDLTSTTVLNGTNCLKDDKSNYLDYLNPYLKIFTHQIILSVFNNVENSNKITLFEGEKNEKEVLQVISRAIKNSINKLQS